MAEQTAAAGPLAQLRAPFARLRARLAARPDTEHEQGILRLIIGSMVFLYFLPDAFRHDDRVPVFVMSVYLVLALIIFVRIAYSTKVSPARRVFAQMADVAAITWSMTVFGESAAPPIRGITLGQGDKAVKVGDEICLFRHDKKFFNPNVFAVAIKASEAGDAAAKKIEAVKTSEIDRVGQKLRVDAIAVTEGLFGESTTANTFMLGVAFQQGAIPISVEAIEEAIELNGASVEANKSAFHWGRQWVLDPAKVRAASVTPEDHLPKPSKGLEKAIVAAGLGDGELGRLVRMRAADLVGYQNEAYAKEYLEVVKSAAASGHTAFAEAVAIYALAVALIILFV